MAELRPTGTLATFSGSPMIVGPAPQWADDSDASYVVLTKSDTVATSFPDDGVVTTLPAFDAGAEGVGDAWLRLKMSPESSPDLLALHVVIDDPVTGGFWQFGNQPEGADYFRLEADGVTRVVQGGATFGDPATLATALAAGGCTLTVYTSYIGTMPLTGPPPSVVTIYEIGFGVPDVTEIRVTRQFPRDDAYGLGSAPRIFPPPRRGRLVGGYQ